MRPFEPYATRTVSILVNVKKRNVEFLRQALDSCLAQTCPPAEIIVFGEIPERVPAIVGRTPPKRITFMEANSRLADALARATGTHIILLEADERLTKQAVEIGFDSFQKNAGATIVHGAHRIIDRQGREASPDWCETFERDRRLMDFPESAVPRFHAATMYKTSAIHNTGTQRLAYDPPTFPKKEDLVVHTECLAEYRLGTVRTMHRVPADIRDYSDWDEGLLLFHHNAPQVFAAAARKLAHAGWSFKTAAIIIRAAAMAPRELVRASVRHLSRTFSHSLPRSIGGLFGQKLWRPQVGKVSFGDFDRIKPISDEDGFDRGKPIDRYYIEQALESCSSAIRGRVLEVGGRGYTLRFGGNRVTSSDVLDINPLNLNANTIADLDVESSLLKDQYDCIILTQTLQYLQNLDTAVANLYRALKPGGVLLLTAPGISPVGKDDLRVWHWNFTALSINTLLEKQFPASAIQLRAYGNVFSAVCFLTGLSVAEVDGGQLDYFDPRYPVAIFAQATK